MEAIKSNELINKSAGTANCIFYPLSNEKSIKSVIMHQLSNIFWTSKFCPRLWAEAKNWMYNAFSFNRFYNISKLEALLKRWFNKLPSQVIGFNQQIILLQKLHLCGI